MVRGWEAPCGKLPERTSHQGLTIQLTMNDSTEYTVKFKVDNDLIREYRWGVEAVLDYLTERVRERLERWLDEVEIEEEESH